jgi:hypothetical protein
MPALATVQMATRNRRYNRKVIVKVLLSIICSRYLGRKGRIWDNAHNLLLSRSWKYMPSQSTRASLMLHSLEFHEKIAHPDSSIYSTG